MTFPIAPPVEPMLAKTAQEIPRTEGFLFEPKWDGFRAIVFRGSGDELFIQSRDLKPLDRYFPELHDALVAALPEGCIVDGEIVIAGDAGLDFEALQMRLHPAASRVAKLAKEIPSSFVAFDLLADGGVDLCGTPQRERRERLEHLLRDAEPPLHLTPITRDRDTAVRWLEEFEGAGLDGVIAKPEGGTYQPGKRAMIKIKHIRSADCAVAGFRWHKAGKGIVGSLLLGLFDDQGRMQHVGVTSAFTMQMRKQLAELLEPLRENALEHHPWREWAQHMVANGDRTPGVGNRWNAGKDMSWEPVRVERVCEVKYDHLQGDRFRHAAIFLRWRPDKSPADCTYQQLEITKPYELERVFGANR
jgi:ATP-dependent DNA ligase